MNFIKSEYDFYQSINQQEQEHQYYYTTHLKLLLIHIFKFINHFLFEHNFVIFLTNFIYLLKDI